MRYQEILNVFTGKVHFVAALDNILNTNSNPKEFVKCIVGKEWI